MSKQLTTTAMQQITRNAIALALVKNRGAVISLLRKYGVNVDKDSKDNQLIIAILVANRSNEKFRQELKHLLLQTAGNNTKNFTAEKSMNFFFTAENGQNFFNAPGDDPNDAWSRLLKNQNTNTATETEKQKTGVGQFLSGNLDKILNTGLSTLSTVITNKSNSKLADKALAIEAEKTKQAQLAAMAAGAGSVVNGKKGLSTGAKIGIGVLGLGGLIVIVYFAFIKKKKG